MVVCFTAASTASAVVMGTTLSQITGIIYHLLLRRAWTSFDLLPDYTSNRHPPTSRLTLLRAVWRPPAFFHILGADVGVRESTLRACAVPRISDISVFIISISFRTVSSQYPRSWFTPLFPCVSPFFCPYTALIWPVISMFATYLTNLLVWIIAPVRLFQLFCVRCPPPTNFPSRCILLKFQSDFRLHYLA